MFGDKFPDQNNGNIVILPLITSTYTPANRNDFNNIANQKGIEARTNMDEKKFV